MFDQESDQTSIKNDDLEANEDSSTVSNGTSVASEIVTRKKWTPVIRRARPVSKRKVFINIFHFILITCFYYTSKYYV